MRIRPSLTHRISVSVIVVALLLVPALVAFGNDMFTDVPNDHVFHDDIGWLADQGITRGCNPPDNTRFCPDEPVTRGQMAAFMRRLGDNTGGGSSGAANRVVNTAVPSRTLNDDTWVTVASTTITAPSAGVVMLEGSSSLFVESAADAGALGLLGATTSPGCTESSSGPLVVWATATAAGVDSAALSGVLPVPRGTSTLRLCALALHLNSFERTEANGSSLTGVWFPATHANLLEESETPTFSDSLDALRQRVESKR